MDDNVILYLLISLTLYVIVVLLCMMCATSKG